MRQPLLTALFPYRIPEQRGVKIAKQFWKCLYITVASNVPKGLAKFVHFSPHYRAIPFKKLKWRLSSHRQCRTAEIAVCTYLLVNTIAWTLLLAF